MSQSRPFSQIAWQYSHNHITQKMGQSTGLSYQGTTPPITPEAYGKVMSDDAGFPNTLTPSDDQLESMELIATMVEVYRAYYDIIWVVTPLPDSAPAAVVEWQNAQKVKAAV